MISIFETQFEKLSWYLKNTPKNLVARFVAYFKRLLFPLYLFPVKLVTYSAYYTVVFVIRFVIALVLVVLEAIVYPFLSLKNLIRSVFVAVVVLYMAASLFVIADYIRTQYGWYGKFFCSLTVKRDIQDRVVRIVGGYSEGSGFFVKTNQVMTNFHVIEGEPSPKIIFSDGSFITPTGIVGDREKDLAILITEKSYPTMVMRLPEEYFLVDEEPLIAAGYPLGTDLVGKATLVKGRFIDYRKSKQNPVGYLQTDINLVSGMSGGPLLDQCGQVVGVNTMGLAGLSLFISGDWARAAMNDFTDQDIAQIEVDPAASPEKAVEAFYTYLKARRMEDGFALLSSEYLKKTNLEEWTNRFTDIIDVEVILTRPEENSKDKVFIKFITKNWNEGEVEYHFYEGTWQTVLEAGVYKMLRSNIKEVVEPGWEWYYE